MRYVKLFPSNHSPCADFVRFDFKAAIPDVEHVTFLCEDPRKQSHDGPAQKSTIGGSVAAIKESILLFRVAVDVAVDPDLPFLNLSQVFEHLFRVKNFWLELLLRIDPLTVQIQAYRAVAIVATNHTIGIEARN